MPSIQNAAGTDDVRGQIVGGDYLQGRLYYEGRAQTASFYEPTEEALKARAKLILEEKRKEFGIVEFMVIWPNNGWELRIA